MPNEIRPTPPANPLVETSRHEAVTRGSTAENSSRQVQENQKAQEAQEAQFRKSAAEAMQKKPEIPSLNQDFLSLVESIAQEAYEAPKAQAGGKSGDQDTGNMAGKQNSGATQKDLQVLREFLRESNYLIRSQNMDVAQMLNTLKVQQGGLFWSRVQEMLQKGIPASQLVLFQNVEKNLQEITKQFMGMEGLSKMPQAPAKEGNMMQPGRALLEILQAESNPVTAMDHYMTALQILMRDNLQDSAQKLVVYMKRRSGLSDYAHQASYWVNELRKDIVAPDPQKVERGFGHWLHLLLGAVSFGILASLGYDWIASLLVGVSIAVILFIFSFVLKK